MIGAAELADMKADAWLLNVSRGGIVDQPALAAAVGARRIGGAYLDVTDPEPLPAHSELWVMPNVIITPHSSWLSPDSGSVPPSCLPTTCAAGARVNPCETWWIPMPDTEFSVDTFRQELRAWLGRELPAIWGSPTRPVRPGEDDDMAMRRRFDRALYAAGWAGLSWPAAYGGRDAPIDCERILAEEATEAGAPERFNRVGLGIVAPAIIGFGSAAHKDRYLRPILNSDEIWCQGFSEPNAGSDLASLSTRATLVDGRWRITGQKVWTTLSAVADFCLLLARTGEPGSAHRGITAFIVPMHQPGVTVRPIRQINDSTEFSEVFFDNAETASDPVIGVVDRGWQLAMSVLAYERSTNLLNRQVRLDMTLRALRRAAGRYPRQRAGTAHRRTR